MTARCRFAGLSVVALLLFCSCVGSRSSSREIPRFHNTIPAPLALRVKDLRPELERNPGVSPAWIYFTTQSEAVPPTFLSYAGNALNVFRAIPGYRVVPPDFSETSATYMLHVDFHHAYARWPIRRESSADKIAVEGYCEVSYTLFKDGRPFLRGKRKSTPVPFKVPVTLVRSDNVEKIVSDSLAYQLDKAMTGVLDQLLLDLAKRWPAFAKP